VAREARIGCRKRELVGREIGVAETRPDVGRDSVAHAREALGFAPASAWHAAFGARAAGAWLSDACGLLGGLPWGRAEVDAAAALAALGAEALRAVHCAPGAAPAELAAALAATRAA